METWRHGEIETWRHGDIETWRRGDMETWTLRHGIMQTWMETWTWIHGHGDMELKYRRILKFYEKIKGEMENRSPGDFPQYVNGSSCKRKFAVCPFAEEETNGSHMLANGLNRLADLFIYACSYVKYLWSCVQKPTAEPCCNCRRVSHSSEDSRGESSSLSSLVDPILDPGNFTG